MDGNVLVILVVFVFFGTIFAVTKTISDHRLRRKIVDAGVNPESIPALLAPARKDADRLGALKWGLVLFGVGVALVIGGFLPPQFEDYILPGLVLIFGAGGLLLFYRITRDKEP